MKKALLILIPILLILAILATACWYFIFYNPVFTSDLLLGWASSMHQNERYERAILYYDLAWKLTPNRIEIPLSLSETYVSAGNYTKAEYTLVSAIASNPDEVSAYIALCNTYVRQDKLLDAVQMLDRITDETVKSELALIRPAAPVISPESGYYTDYIEVTIDAPDGRVYATVDGEYPSNDDDLYAAPLTMEAGESTVIALAVNDQGLVSPASITGYTVGGVVEPVVLTDPAVEDAVRQLLNLTADKTIMTDDLWSVTALELPDTVSDLSDLAYFTGLRSLTISNVSGLDFTVIRQLSSLEYLSLSGCTISSNALEAIGSLHSLVSLKLDSCALTDLSALAGLTQLRELQLSNNSISDISVLSLMQDLEVVSLSNNPLESIAGLSTCDRLETVDITGCGVTSLAALSNKQALRVLMASNNQISDISALENSAALETLVISNNSVSDISALLSMPSLMTFEANTNTITEIPAFSKDSQLVRFYANYNQIEDLSGLSGISTLNYVELDYNQIADIQPLVNNYNLIQLDVWDNPIPEITEAIKPFEENSIIVNYNPNFEVPEEEPEEE